MMLNVTYRNLNFDNYILDSAIYLQVGSYKSWKGQDMMPIHTLLNISVSIVVSVGFMESRQEDSSLNFVMILNLIILLLLILCKFKDNQYYML